MKKKILPVVLTLGIAASLAVPYAGYAASTTEKIDQQLTQLKKQKAEAQQKANDAQNQITKVQVREGPGDQGYEHTCQSGE